MNLNKLNKTTVSRTNGTYDYYNLNVEDARLLVKDYKGHLISSDDIETVFILNNGWVVKFFLDIEVTLFESLEYYHFDQDCIIKKIKGGPDVEKIVLDDFGHYHFYRMVDKNIFYEEQQLVIITEQLDTPKFSAFITNNTNVFLEDKEGEKFYIFPSLKSYELFRERNQGISILKGFLKIRADFPYYSRDYAREMIDNLHLSINFEEHGLYELDKFIKTLLLDDKFYYDYLVSVIAYVGEVYVSELNWKWELIFRDDSWLPYLINKNEDLVPFFVNVSNTINPDYTAFSSLYGPFIFEKMKKV